SAAARCGTHWMKRWLVGLPPKPSRASSAVATSRTDVDQLRARRVLVEPERAFGTDPRQRQQAFPANVVSRRPTASHARVSMSMRLHRIRARDQVDEL